MTTEIQDKILFNTFVAFEKVLKTRVKNAMACDKEIIPIDEKKNSINTPELLHRMDIELIISFQSQRILDV